MIDTDLSSLQLDGAASTSSLRGSRGAPSRHTCSRGVLGPSAVSQSPLLTSQNAKVREIHLHRLLLFFCTPRPGSLQAPKDSLARQRAFPGYGFLDVPVHAAPQLLWG